jgi:NADH:ubiquinone oxidoreductase subunit
MATLTWTRRAINALRRINYPGKEMRFVGRDAHDNMYFEAATTAATRSTRAGTRKRAVQLATGPAPLAEYDLGALPIQWQAWLRHTRAHPPTVEEEVEAERQRQAILTRADDLDRKRGEGRYAFGGANAGGDETSTFGALPAGMGADTQAKSG